MHSVNRLSLIDLNWIVVNRFLSFFIASVERWSKQSVKMHGSGEDMCKSSLEILHLQVNTSSRGSVKL